MSNEKLARQWAEKIKTLHVSSPEMEAAAEHILDTTEPEKPQLTRWDGVEMDGREWVVQAVSETGALQLIAADGSAYAHDFAENVIPNRKRYELREIGAGEPDEPTHPATLTTEQDYNNAPKGTIVDIDDCMVRRGMYGWRISGARSQFTSYEMAQLGEGDVIRWGGWDK